ncbi:protein of unknown function [Paraburkholderia kururiensis]
MQPSRLVCNRLLGGLPGRRGARHSSLASTPAAHPARAVGLPAQAAPFRPLSIACRGAAPYGL